MWVSPCVCCSHTDSDSSVQGQFFFHLLREAEHHGREAAGEQAPPFMKERQQGTGQKEEREKLRCSALEPAHRDLGTLRLDIPPYFRVQIFLKQPPHGV